MSIVIAKPGFLAHIDDEVWRKYSPAQKREAIERQLRIDKQSQKPTAPAPADPKVSTLLLRIQTDKEWIKDLKALWGWYFPDFQPPPDSQFLVWINRFHDYGRVVLGMEGAQAWLAEKAEHPHKKKFEEHPGPVTQQDIRQYISGVIKRGPKEDDGGA
jgi:hypothetical protein